MKALRMMADALGLILTLAVSIGIVLTLELAIDVLRGRY